MHILVVEDDPAVSHSIQLMLRSENCTVHTTDLGEEGVELAKLNAYDIIFLDLNLPDLSGYEVLQSLRTANVNTPILILSGLVPQPTRSKGSALGPTTTSPSRFTKTSCWRACRLSCAARKDRPKRWCDAVTWSSMWTRNGPRSPASLSR